MTAASEALFRDHIYRVTGEPVVANTDSSIGTARELHLKSCRLLLKYAGSPVLVPLSDAEVDQAWLQAIEDDTTTEMLSTAWPFSAETGWCPRCIVKKLKPRVNGLYQHPGARSPKWRPGVPLACRFPAAHGLGHCGCDGEDASTAGPSGESA